MCLTLIIRVSLLLTFIFGSLVKHADAAGLYNRAELACLSVLFRNFQTKSTADCFLHVCVVPSLHDCLQQGSTINFL